MWDVGCSMSELIQGNHTLSGLLFLIFKTRDSEPKFNHISDIKQMTTKI
jgi:hypothetical protein